jgi:hypothetical protein
MVKRTRSCPPFRYIDGTAGFLQVEPSHFEPAAATQQAESRYEGGKNGKRNGPLEKDFQLILP